MTDQTPLNSDSPHAALLQVDPHQLSYEQARDGLVAVVTALESGGTPLADTMSLWRKGEDLAKRCEELLAGAQAELAQSTAGEQSNTTG